MATVLRSATGIASDLEGLRLVLASTVGDRYRIEVPDDRSEIRLRRRRSVAPRADAIAPSAGCDASVADIVGIGGCEGDPPWAAREPHSPLSGHRLAPPDAPEALGSEGRGVGLQLGVADVLPRANG